MDQTSTTTSIPEPRDPDAGPAVVADLGTPDQRSLRGSVAALSRLAAIAGPLGGVLRFERITVAGDHVTIGLNDTVRAAVIAAHLGLPDKPFTENGIHHVWQGHTVGLKVTVVGIDTDDPAPLVAEVFSTAPVTDLAATGGAR